ncbi:MAG: SMC-Scp complex subunit ScpB [Deltaproteobacteria bacterium]|nr:SMC-Scp complex subunit ScpB [Deltaproteobacteria bacterium]
MLDKISLKPVLESLIFAADSAISFEKLANVLEGEDRQIIKEALAELIEDYKARSGGFLIEEVAGGYQFRTNPEFAPWLRKFFKIGAQKISKAAMESLAIIAYKQPLTRGELEAIRGVDSGGVLATLMEKRFIKIVGRREVPGRPVVYGTTREFLETFDLKDLSCLPSLKDLQKMEEENAAQNPPESEEGAGEQEQEGGPSENGRSSEQGRPSQEAIRDEGEDSVLEAGGEDFPDGYEEEHQEPALEEEGGEPLRGSSEEISEEELGDEGGDSVLEAGGEDYPEGLGEEPILEQGEEDLTGHCEEIPEEGIGDEGEDSGLEAGGEDLTEGTEEEALEEGRESLTGRSEEIPEEGIGDEGEDRPDKEKV